MNHLLINAGRKITCQHDLFGFGHEDENTLDMYENSHPALQSA